MSTQTSTFPAQHALTWPAKLRAYYAALKPERTYANVMTTAAGFLFASRWHGNWALLFYVLIGTTLIVMSACAVNNLTDRGLDVRMPRTRERGTVTGQVPARGLAAIAVVFGLVGLAILAVHVNWLTVLVGAVGYVDYVILYAWAKRTTVYSTLVGTISGAAPIVAGYTAATGRFDLAALLLGLVMIFWQMPHFYAIGIFRLEDYRAGGLPIWPVRYGVRNTQVWILIYTALYLLAAVALAAFGRGGFGSGNAAVGSDTLFEHGITVAAVIGGLGLYWLWRGLAGFGAQQPAKWARGMFGFSLITLLALCAGVALAPLLP